tara:strand:- start:6144 stop:8354 length:2211 start_codon:yes stop_codon:yes gene_type:complete
MKYDETYEAQDVGDMSGEATGEFNNEGPSEEELQGIVGSALDDAVDFIDNTISPLRATSIDYYQGKPFGNEEDGRSQVISLDVHDTIADILPSIMRIFFSSENVVEFVPFGKEDIKLAEQATDYINRIVLQQDNDGFPIFYNAFKDALLCKNGILKYYWDTTYHAEYYEYSRISDNELAVLEADDEVEVTEVISYPDPAFPKAEAVVETEEQIEEVIPELMQQSMMTPQLHDVKVTRKKEHGCVRVESVPPEEFLIDRDATSMKDAYCIAHRRYLTVSDLVEMGYDYDEVQKFATPYETQLDDNAEYQARNTYSDAGINPVEDDANLKVQYVEAYMKIDMTGDGIAELRRLCCVGDNYEIKKNLKCDQIPFVSFCPDPEPHTFFGLSIADITEDIQKVKSMVMRSMLDSLALSVHPRVAVVEGQANIEDVMNTEVGGIIRQRNAGAVQPFNMPFVGKDCFPMLNYLDEVKENRTGISKASMGLDPDALQSATASAVQATVQGGQQHIELIARIFAETGMKPLFKGIYELLARHQDKERTVRLRNEWIPIDPRVWQTGMDCVVNVGLGNGTAQERMQYLGQIASKQEQILQTLGASNPLVEMTQYRNTMAKMVELAGFKDASMFFKEVPEMTPEQRQSMMQKKPDVSEQLIQVQIQEIKANMMKANAKIELETEEMKRRDDLDRDKLDAEIMLKAAEIEAKYGTQVETTVIRALVERDREQMKAQTKLVSDMARVRQ